MATLQLLRPDNFHGNPHVADRDVVNVKAAGFQCPPNVDRPAIHQVGKMPVRPFESLYRNTLLAFFRNTHHDNPPPPADISAQARPRNSFNTAYAA